MIISPFIKKIINLNLNFNIKICIIVSEKNMIIVSEKKVSLFVYQNIWNEFLNSNLIFINVGSFYFWYIGKSSFETFLQYLRNWKKVIFIFDIFKIKNIIRNFISIILIQKKVGRFYFWYTENDSSKTCF